MKIGAFLLLLVLICAPSVNADPMVGVNFDGDAFLIDSSTGTGSFLGATGFFALNSMAKNSAGVLYSQGTLNFFDSELITINPSTGAGTFVASLSVGLRGLAFSPTDVLYGIVSGRTTSDIDSLYKIDTTTGAATLIGLTGFSGIQGLEFSPAGILYGWDITRGLLTIDPSTGVATRVNPLIDASEDIQTLAFAPDGTLYGARDALFKIDTSTGVQTFVGTGGYSDIRGIEFVPEPSAILLLLSTGLLCLAGTATRNFIARSKAQN